MEPALTERATYRVQVERDGDWWLINVPEVSRARSQARRLDQVELTTRDLLGLILDRPEDSFDLDIDVRLPAGVSKALEIHKTARRELGEVQARVSAATEEAARRLVRDGHLTYRDAAKLLGLSFQRVHKLVGSH